MVAQSLHDIRLVHEAVGPVAGMYLQAVNPTVDAPPREAAVLVGLQDMQQGASDRWSHATSVLSTHFAAGLYQHRTGNSARPTTSSWQVKVSSSGLQAAACSEEQCNEMP